MTEGRTWTLEYRAQPPLMNAERSGHWRTRSRSTEEWRSTFGWLAREQRVPHLEACSIVVEHLVGTRRRVDPVACFPAAKAAIDGLVDVGVLDDDCGPYVRSVMFCAPEYVRGVDAVRLIVTAVES